MARIEIPEHPLPRLGPEMKMDTHEVDVKLRDGTRYFRLVVRGGRFITGRRSDLNGEGDLPFSADRIGAIRRVALLGPLWPFWG